MKLINYSLTVGKKILIEDLNLEFKQGYINHLLGSNGVGKSCLAKSCVGILPHKGAIDNNKAPILIGSYSNVPSDLTLKDIYKLLSIHYEGSEIDTLIKLLNINKLSNKLKIKMMSDGQKQKVKYCVF